MIKISDDNPFKDKIYLSQARSRKITKTGEVQKIHGQDISVSITKEYVPITFAQVFRHTVLNDLSSQGSKLLLYIIAFLGYEEQKIRIKRADTGMSKHLFSRAMVELMSIDVIRPVAHKRELYWVNLGIICVGSIERAEHQSPPRQSTPISG